MGNQPGLGMLFEYFAFSVARLSATAEEHTRKAPSLRNSFPSVGLPLVTPQLEAFAGVLTQLYGTIFLAAWNSYFPTTTERTLWQISSVVCVAYGAIGCAIAALDRYSERLLKRCCQGRRREAIVQGHTCAQDIGGGDVELSRPAANCSNSWPPVRPGRGWLQRLSNLSAYNDPQLDMAPPVWISVTLL